MSPLVEALQIHLLLMYLKTQFVILALSCVTSRCSSRKCECPLGPVAHLAAYGGSSDTPVSKMAFGTCI